MKKFIPCTFDPVFKSILTDSNLRDYLCYLISEITDLNYEELYDNLVIEDNELMIKYAKEKSYRTDLVVSINKNKINIEANREKSLGLIVKNNAYLHWIASDKQIGDVYEENYVYQINFNEYNHFKKHNNVLDKVMPMNVETGEIEEEPFKILAITFIGGVVSLFLTKFLATKYQNYIPFLIEENPNLESYKIFLISFGEIGLIEELSKFLILYILIWRNKNFNYIYDAIVYSVFISLGFATLENINYLWYGDFNTLIIRSIFTIPAHASFGIIMGYYFGYAKYYFHMKYQNNAIKYFYSGLFFVIIYHGLFDYFLAFDNKYKMIFFIVFSIYLFINAILKLQKASKLEISW